MAICEAHSLRRSRNAVPRFDAPLWIDDLDLLCWLAD